MVFAAAEEAKAAEPSSSSEREAVAEHGVDEAEQNRVPF
jgi:hypothetical protein